MRPSVRNKLAAVCFSTLLFSGLGILAVLLVHGELQRAVPVVLGIGLSLSLFEEFYVRGRPGAGSGRCTLPSRCSSTAS
jgi:hypothetical protein